MVVVVVVVVVVVAAVVLVFSDVIVSFLVYVKILKKKLQRQRSLS